MAFRTHYDNLKVPRTATKVEIKKSYRRLCSQHHPDKHPKENQEKQNRILMIINKSYFVLSNDKLRKEHDEWIAHRELCERNARQAEEERTAQQQKKQQERERQQKEAREKAQREKMQQEREQREKEQKEREFKRRKEEEERRAAEEERIRKEAKEIEEARRQALQEMATKEANESMDNGMKILYKTVILIFVTMAVYNMIFDSPDKIPSQPIINTPTHNVPKAIKHESVPVKQNSKPSLPSPVIIKNVITSMKNGERVIDIYVTNHRNEVTVESLKQLLRGSLINAPNCKSLPSPQYVFHFLKGGNRMYIKVPIEHLCSY